MKQMIIKFLFIALCSFSILGCDNTSFGIKEQYKIIINNVDYTPGKEFDINDLFEGYNSSLVMYEKTNEIDEVYSYNSYQITVSEIDGKKIIYSVDLLDDGIETLEGIKVTNSVENVKDIYGEPLVMDEQKMVYEKDDIRLVFYISSGYVISISYNYLID